MTKQTIYCIVWALLFALGVALFAYAALASSDDKGCCGCDHMGTVDDIIRCWTVCKGATKHPGPVLRSSMAVPILSDPPHRKRHAMANYDKIQEIMGGQ